MNKYILLGSLLFLVACADTGGGGSSRWSGDESNDYEKVLSVNSLISRPEGICGKNRYYTFSQSELFRSSLASNSIFKVNIYLFDDGTYNATVDELLSAVESQKSLNFTGTVQKSISGKWTNNKNRISLDLIGDGVIQSDDENEASFDLVINKLQNIGISPKNVLFQKQKQTSERGITSRDRCPGTDAFENNLNQARLKLTSLRIYHEISVQNADSIWQYYFRPEDTIIAGKLFTIQMEVAQRICVWRRGFSIARHILIWIPTEVHG